MYLLILYLPLISSFTCGFFGRFIGSRGSSVFSIFLIGISFINSLLIFFEVGLKSSKVQIKLFSWLDSNILSTYWGFLFDSLTSSMLVIVLFISFLVHVYSFSYMSTDPHISRFMAFLSLFTFFMVVLVTADNFIQLFVGWEGVGLSSYLLINFWFTRVQANKSAMKAIIINRVGDLGLCLSIILIFGFFGSTEFAVVFPLIYLYTFDSFFFLFSYVDILSAIVFLLFIGAVGKSAQIGLHTWLPDAMEGPTPVSALIHAATMVTAGVFILIRVSPILEYCNSVLFVITCVGSLTSFFAATTGLFQNDLKRVIAYSTCSQLGYMVFACGLSNYLTSIFHLVNHAFFKALLFLSAGSIIHALSDEQDMRKMGGLIKLLPFSYIMVFVGSLALMGFPFLTGFYSKDIILEISFSKFSIESNFAYWLGLISAFFTSFYSIRLIFFTFISKPNGYRVVFEKVHESPFSMSFPLFILALASIFAGFVAQDMFIGVGTSFWANSIYVLLNNNSSIDAEFLPLYVKILPFFFSCLAILVFLLIYTVLNNWFSFVIQTEIFKNFYIFFNKKWYFDIFYNEFLVKGIFYFGYFLTFKIIDRGFVEFFGPLGLTRFLITTTKSFSIFQSRYLFNYLLVIVFSYILFLWVVHLEQFFLVYEVDSSIFIYLFILVLLFII